MLFLRKEWRWSRQMPCHPPLPHLTNSMIFVLQFCLAIHQGRRGERRAHVVPARRKRRLCAARRSSLVSSGRWMMVHHHASLPPPPQPNKELRTALGFGGGFQLGEVGAWRHGAFSIYWFSSSLVSFFSSSALSLILTCAHMRTHTPPPPRKRARDINLYYCAASGDCIMIAVCVCMVVTCSRVGINRVRLRILLVVS